MFLSWFDAREAARLGESLADAFVSQADSPPASRHGKSRDAELGNETRNFLLRVDREIRPLKLNTFKRAKLGNTFRWRLLERGMARELVEELTRMLLVRLSAGSSDNAAPPGFVSLPARKRRLPDGGLSLLARGRELA